MLRFLVGVIGLIVFTGLAIVTFFGNAGSPIMGSFDGFIPRSTWVAEVVVEIVLALISGVVAISPTMECRS